MRYFTILSVFLIFWGCEDSKKDKKIIDQCEKCKELEICVDNQCEMIEGRCYIHNDCIPPQYCGDQNFCISPSPCDNCFEWESCINNDCSLSDGRCYSDQNCENGYICDQNHNCIEYIDPCDNCFEWESCINNECSLLDGRCYSDQNCENGYICDQNHNCIEYIDPCDNCFEWESCINNECSLSDGRCYSDQNCENGYICDQNHNCIEYIITECTESTITYPNIGIEEPDGIGGCPNGMIPIGDSGFCIDRWEAFIVEIDQNGEEQPFSPYFNPEDKDIMAKSAPNAIPQGYITQVQASNSCERAGKRLCSREEWELACRGLSNNIYPYGNSRDETKCNGSRDQHPVIEYFGTSESWIWSELDHPCINQLDNSLDRTGVNSECISEFSVYDMMGNLHEWIDDQDGTFKGGYYVDTYRNGEGCLYTTTAHNIYHWDYSTGFRCCYSLE